MPVPEFVTVTVPPAVVFNGWFPKLMEVGVTETTPLLAAPNKEKHTLRMQAKAARHTDVWTPFQSL
jgi:hypothetical protein